MEPATGDLRTNMTCVQHTAPNKAWSKIAVRHICSLPETILNMDISYQHPLGMPRLELAGVCVCECACAGNAHARCVEGLVDY